MRDTHRMKEKFDLSLDGRQVGGLFIGGIVVLGAVFVLGVVVGKKLATNDQAQAAPDLLTALDQRAQTALTFQEELTKQQPVALPPPEPKPVVVAPAEKPAEKPVEKPAPAPKPEPAQVEPAVAKADPPSESTRTASADAVTARTNDGLKNAFARVQEVKAQPPAEAVPNGAFTLQLSASQNSDEANRFAAQLRDRGYAPYIVKADVPGKGTWYRVRMGSFPTKEAAQRYLSDFKRETQIDAYIASN